VKAKDIIDTMGTAARVNRLKAADWFLAHPENFKDLLLLTFDTSYRLHYKAAWVTEFVVLRHSELLQDDVLFFIDSLPKIKKDSAARPLAKVCALVSKHLIAQKSNIFQQKITQDDVNKLISVAFDWLIGDFRVATQVHAMQIIFELGQLPDTEAWVHRELKQILINQIPQQSAGFRSRAKNILKKMT
jgi:hypothetical protein